jgi:cyanophycin synthetase
VYFNEELKIIGDYSGFGGAAAALAMPAVQIAVLEVARGGILLRGIGTAHNDAAVLTNVSEDHLDQHGIRTLDQLAEVKATITRITKPDGWDILNADDPRVLGTRRIARGRIWLYSMDHDHPAIRHVLAERGRSMTVVDGCLVAAYSRHEASKLMPLEDIPVTLAGISSQHIHNAMAAAAAALSVGLPETAVVEGLRSFVLDQRQNPGRANLFEVDGKVVVVDYAHNEEGMKGLVEIARGLCRPDSSTWLTFCSAGDRTNAILHRLAYTAARGFDKVMVAELERYLRGRDPKELVDRLKAGVVDGGKPEPVVMKDEMTALKSMLAEAGPGDVVAITALSQRPEVFAYLSARSAKELGPERVRELVRQARG